MTVQHPKQDFSDIAKRVRGPSINPFPAPGVMGVDWEQRLDFRRLHDYRLGRAKDALKRSELGAVLVFDMNNVRYLTSTHIGEWARDKISRWALLAGDSSPYLWDFGSAAAHHRLHCPWLDPDRVFGGMVGLRGAVAPEAGLFEHAAKELRSILEMEGVADMPLGIDIVELPMIEALRAEGIEVRDGQQVMLDARQIKSADEIMLLNQAAAMVDGAYHLMAEHLKPGVKENEIVALAAEFLFDRGSEHVEAINAVSGERGSPHPHVFADRLLRPGDQVFFDVIHSFMGYRTCYYRTFSVGRSTKAQEQAYKRARSWIDVAVELLKPGITTDVIAREWPTAEELGIASEYDAFGLQFGHGVGLGLHERPIISRLNSLTHPIEVLEGMTFAVETYWPAEDGSGAARIEEEVVITADGAEVITRFPAEELFVANKY
jgi:Xaa-Pro dipeptidase